MSRFSVGASLLAIAIWQSAQVLNVPASSRAGSLLQVERYRDSGYESLFCRSEPARDGDPSAGTGVECAGLIASRLAPTGRALSGLRL
ncbi:hypothetical protein DKY63_32015 [Pseudomonas putida]|uniref:Uncharacterized protein n=1 Tax=Pseudomonas putida TaxID=303 RepID=A0A2Z4RU95_PSEPU|nr:hypothetical protein DKY63_32015 [Pseudomonas putida]